MKIVHVAQMLQGGIGSYLSEILPWQVERLGAGNVVAIVAANQVPYLPPLPPGSVRSFTTSSRSPLALARMALAIRRMIDRERPDVLHLHSSFAGAMVRLAYALPPWRRPRIVYCAHGWSFNMRVGRFWKGVFALVERLLAPLADRILCISQFELDAALRRGLPSSKLRLAYNGIAAEPPAGEGPPVHFPKDRLNLLFLGRQDRQKGFDLLAAAMRRLEGRPIHLHAVGAAVLAKEGVEPDASPNISQHGWQDRSRIPLYIDAADAVVVPSRWEGFGLVTIEAMRQGRTVLASAVDALPELVVEGETGYLFAPDDVDALVSLFRLLDREEFARLGRNGRGRFLELFTADRLNALLLATYRELAEKPPG